MPSRLLARSKGRKLGRRMGRKKRSHKDDCASTKRCNILSAPGNVDSTKQTDPRAKPAPVCAYILTLSYITSTFFVLLTFFFFFCISIARLILWLCLESRAISSRPYATNYYYRILYRRSASQEIRGNAICVNNYF